MSRRTESGTPHSAALVDQLCRRSWKVRLFLGLAAGAREARLDVRDVDPSVRLVTQNDQMRGMSSVASSQKRKFSGVPTRRKSANLYWPGP
jgi:hypothetical protein